MIFIHYKNRIIGPIAPDNPLHNFDHPDIHMKAAKWAKELELMSDVKHTVIDKSS